MDHGAFHEQLGLIPERDHQRQPLSTINGPELRNRANAEQECGLGRKLASTSRCYWVRADSSATSIEHAAACSFLSEPSDTDCPSDVDGHSIFAKFNGTGIALSHKRQYRRRGVVVREHRKFWLDPLKYPPGL